MKINYKSDFDFILDLKDSQGESIGWPLCDFCIELTTVRGMRGYRAYCIGGETLHCFNDNGRLHVVCDHHGLAPGQVVARVTLHNPSAMYPDGLQDLCLPIETGIELVTGLGDTEVTGTVEVALPVIVRTAYEMAVAAGYGGTEQEYMRVLTRVVGAVETADDVARSMLSDWTRGKARVARALTLQGVATDADASLDEMAEGVLSIERRIDGDASLVPWSEMGSQRADLLNIMNQNCRPELPYMWACSFGDRRVLLGGADAYLCSDGYFTTEAGEHVFADDSVEYWVLYYNASPQYTATLPGNIVAFSEWLVYNGEPMLTPAGNVRIGAVTLLSERFALPATGDLLNRTNVGALCVMSEGITAGSRLIYGGNTPSSIRMPRLTASTLTGELVFSSSLITSLELPALTEQSGGTIARECGALTSLELPALTTQNGGTIANTCGALTSLELPALTTQNGGTIASSCGALTTLELPALTTQNGGTIASSCGALTSLELPALISMACNSAYCGITNTNYDLDVYLPIVNTLTGPLLSGNKGKVTVHLGRQQFAENITLQSRSGDFITGITCEPGFRSAITVPGSSKWEQESVRAFVDNLADNSDGPTLALQIGAANIAKLTAEQVATAQAKNYSLS